jgi:hypothetical protein
MLQLQIIFLSFLAVYAKPTLLIIGQWNMPYSYWLDEWANSTPAYVTIEALTNLRALCLGMD